MRLYTIAESASSNLFYKFYDPTKDWFGSNLDVKDQFVRIGGYCSPFDGLMDWINDSNPHSFTNLDEDEIAAVEYKLNHQEIGNYLSVPYSGYLYEVAYDGEIIPTPWDMFTPGQAGPPDNILKPDHLQQIIGQPTYDEGFDVYTSFGYPGGSFDRDVIRNIPAHYSEQNEVIINVEVPYRKIAEPIITKNNGYAIFLLSEIHKNK